MAEEQTRMDGNSAAGLLAEVFSFEMTTSLARCAGCGTTHLVGTLLVYGADAAPPGRGGAAGVRRSNRAAVTP
jgi:hypothetical protein